MAKKKLLKKINKMKQKKKEENDEEKNKFRPVKKSKFVGETAKLLQEQLMKNIGKNNNENNCNNIENNNDIIHDNQIKKDETKQVNEIINEKPVSTKKRKKSKMVFLGENN